MALFTTLGAVVGAAVGAVSTFIGGLGTVGTFLLNSAVGVGVNLLAQAVAGKPKSAAGASFGINGTLQAGGDIPRSFILGQSATAGSLVWANTWGQDGETPNAYLTQVIAMEDLPGHTLAGVIVNGEPVTFGPTPHADYGYPVTQYKKGGVDHLWVKWYDGTQTIADDFLVSKASNANRTWESTRVGLGVPYAIVTAKVARNMFSGIPSFKFVVAGLPLYDPSKDSTVSGGSGSHRWNNPATWGGDGDKNPVVQIYNLLRGIQYDDQWFYGLQGLTAARLPTAAWIAQINKCRTANTYRAGGEIPVDVPLTATIEALLTACQGRLSEVGGVYNIFVGEPDEPVASFTDGDILSTEGQSFTPFFGLADTINGIAATYPSPADGWSEKAAPPIYRPDLEVLAGNRRLMADVSLSFVPYDEQVQRLMKSALAEAQRARRHTLVLPPEYWPYAVPGETLSWTSARNGYVNKWFRIDGAVDRANLDVMVDITEVDPEDYDWDSEADFQPPVDGALGTLRPAPQPLVGWQVFPATVGSDDSEIPSIRVSFAGNLDDVRTVRVQARLDGEEDPLFDGDVPYGDPVTNPNPSSVILSGTFAPNTAHEVRGMFLPFGSRETEWSEWLPVTTPDVIWFDKQKAFELSLVSQTDAVLGSVSNRDSEMRRQVASAAEATIRSLINNAQNRAEIRTERTQRLTAQEAFAQQRIELEASISSAVGLIVEEQTVRANADNVLASSLQTISSALDGNIATVTELAESFDGVGARWGVIMSVNGDILGVVQMSVDGASLSAFSIQADRFFIAQRNLDGGDPVPVFSIQTVNGTPKLAFRGDMFADGFIQARHISALSISTLIVTDPDMTYYFNFAEGRIGRFDGKFTIDLKNMEFEMLFDDA